MIPLIKSTFYKEKETKKFLRKFIHNADKLSFGKQCEIFENKFRKWQGRKYSVFLNSRSSANLAIVQTLINLGKLKKGDCVGFSALTWSTNVMPLIQLGLSPVPIDVELDTLNISVKTIDKVLKKYPVKMIFITNLLGLCHDLDSIAKLLLKKKIILLEDNCEALGSVFKGVKLGNYGLASTFSFYVGHHMSTIEGGAVCTNSEKIASMLRLVRAHGWDRNLSVKKQIKLQDKHKINSKFYSRYTFYDLGYNLRPTEINGFIGNTQINHLDKIVKIRQKNYREITNILYKYTDSYHPIRSDHLDLLSNFAIPIVCKSKKIRNDLVERCNGKIEIRPIVGGDMSQQPFFKKYSKNLSVKCPNANLVHEQGLYFGNNPELTKSDKQTIIKIFSL